MSIPSIPQETLAFIESFELPNQQRFLELCAKLGEELYRVNETTNLTAIPADQFWTKHVADSLSVAKVIPEIKTWNCEMGDIGCGAGFPSLVLAAAFPKLRITSIDSTLKKIVFVEETASAMGLGNLRCEHGRGIEMGRQQQWRNRFKFMTARAVGALPKLMTETAALVNKEGVLAVFRTPKQCQEELDALKLAPVASSAAWKVTDTEPFDLPSGAGQRNFILCRRS